MNQDKPIRALYSFPLKLGVDRICMTVWQQVNSLTSAGVDILDFPGVLHKPVPAKVKVQRTLAWEKLRISGLSLVPEITWKAAGVKLRQAYQEVIASKF